MEFKTAAQKEAYERIAGYLKELFGETARANATAPSFGIASGSAYVQVGVYARGDADVFVNTWAWVVQGAERTPELMAYLLNENVNIYYGAFGMDEAGDIIFRHGIKGTTCDKEELRASIAAVVFTSDQEDDKIIARWGGRRATDPTK